MAMSSTLGLIMPHVRSGRLRALAVSSAARSNALPEVPAIAETVRGYEDVQWAAFMAPAGTPADIIDRLQKEIVSILRMPETRERLAIDSAEVVGSTPEELTAFLRAEIAKWVKVVKAVGIEPE
jgi:tripartite-type tricarboxylate transporter receptor subunit TctC